MSRGGRPPPGLDNMYSLKVDNLTYRTSPETLKRAFEKYGDVGDVYIPRDKYSRESRGFAFVRFYDKMDAEDAIDGMDGRMMDGRELRVAMARYARPTESPHDRREHNYRSRKRPRSYNYRRSYSRSLSHERRYSRSRSRSRSYDRRRRSRRSRSRSSSKSSRSSRSPTK